MELAPLAQLVSLSDKVAVVTGGAMGIGQGIVIRLAEAGASVVIADTNEPAANQVAQAFTDHGWKVAVKHLDVSDETSVRELVAFCKEKFGRIDILVNNAGIYPAKPIAQMSLADFNKVIGVNLSGVFLMTKYTSELMKQHGGGRIINISSIDALHPSMVGLSHYDASKHGVWGFTKNAALELAPYKIWVNAIAPGSVQTPGATATQAGGPPVDAEMLKKQTEAFISKIPMGRIGQPDDIGKVALFLASDLSSYMTGEQIVVDGGVLLS